MASPSLPLSGIVQVSVFVSPQSAVAPTFNIGLIVGTSTVIPSVGANSRVQSYGSASAMLTAGFSLNSAEYLAALLYFAQSPAPFSVQIGRQDLTALIGGAVDAAGSGYAVGDTGTIAGGTAGKLATYQVTTISGGGSTGPVTGITITSGGTGYTAAVGAATTATSGAGTGLTITTTGDVGETCLIALTACRVASSTWYGAVCTGANTADCEAIALYAQSATPPMMYFHTTSDAAVLDGTVGNLAATLKAAAYTRVFLDYATTQGGAAPNNIYACAAAMGVMMGLNTGLAGSYFTMKFKLLTGIIPEPLTGAGVTAPGGPSGQIGTIESNNCNLYLGYSGPYTILEQGTTPLTNTFADEILNRDMLTAAIQYNVMNLLVASNSVPQTNMGESQLINEVNQACQAAVVRGYLAPGIWQGPQVLTIPPGKSLPGGYLCVAQSYNQQSAGAKAARQAMPIYCCVIEAGAVHSLVIGVYVQQ